MARKAGASGRQGRTDIELEIADFGPIARGRIALRPLTVLVGPNNSGKTYASVLAHSVISSFADLAGAARQGRRAGAPLEGGVRAPRGLAGDARGRETRRPFGELLLSHIRRNFASPLGDLVREGSRSSRVRIGGPMAANVSISCGGMARLRADPGLVAAAMPPGQSHYLPAARSGVVCVYGALAPGALHARDGSAQGGAGMAGPVSDLVGSLARCRRRGGATNGGGRVIPDVFGGSVARRGAGTGEISYSHMGARVPIHRSSSGVAGVAPLAMAAAAMRRGDTLIVEEPEAHLHPKSQVALARHLVALVRRGMRVVLSTHSDFLLGQLDISVKLGSLTPSVRAARGYGRDSYVRDDEVAPYAFAGGARKGYAISELEHSAADGIAHEGFMSVVESMAEDDYGIYLARGR